MTALPRFLGALAVLLLLLTQPAFAEKEDMLKLLGKDPIKAFVTKESLKGIEYSDATNSITMTVDVDKVEWVVYKDAVPQFLEAMQALEVGNYDRALKKTVEAQRSQTKSEGNWHKAYYDYYLAYCLFELARKNNRPVDKARERLAAFAAGNPTSRFVPWANYYAAMCSLLMGEVDAAKQNFAALEKDPPTRLLAVKARFGMASCLVREGKLDAALSQCQAIIKQGENSPEIMEIIIMVLIDSKKDAAKAVATAKELSVEGPALCKVFELSGCAKILGQNYREAFDDLLKAYLGYGGADLPASPRLVANLAVALKVLMEKEKSSFPEWEYKPFNEKLLREPVLTDQLRKWISDYKP